MKTKILILSFYYPPDLCAGSFRCSAFVKSLQQKFPHQLEIDVITTSPNRYKSFKNEANAIERKDELTIYRINLPNHKSGFIDQSLAFLFYARNALKITKENKYDLVFGTSSRLMTAALAAFISKRKSVPLYLDIRDIFVDTMDDVLPRFLAKFFIPIFNLIERYTINQAQHVNLVSEGFHAYFINKYPKQKYSFFTNGIDDEFLNKNYRFDSRNNSEVTTILYAGNIGEGQGLHNIIPELSQLLGANYQFIIFGDGGKRAELQHKVTLSKIKNVEIKDPVNREELIANYVKSDILFLHLNHYDAFEKVLPSKLFEYAATGKPILAGVSGYSKEFIQEKIKNAVVFSPGHAADAVQAIQKLKLEETDRADFKRDFSRAEIMNSMSDSLINYLNNQRE